MTENLGVLLEMSVGKRGYKLAHPDSRGAAVDF